MLKITLATGNKHKVEEINLIANGYDIDFVLPDGDFNPVEDGKNFLENAYIKALCASKTPSDTEFFLADDSGLCVKVLNGEPGLKSARYAPSAPERIKKLLGAMSGIKDRTAEFVCAMVLINKKGEILYQTEEKCKGRIMEEERGTGGFGYDPIFFVDEVNKGMAELTALEKSRVSHRAKALNNILNWIRNEQAKLLP